MDWSWNILIDPFRDLMTSIFNYLPKLVGALVLLLIAWILARVFRAIVRRAIRLTKIDERLGRGGGEAKDESQFPVAQGAGTVVYWLVWIFFGLAILEALGVEGMLDPVQLLFERIFEALPNIIAAGLVLFIFYLIARLLASWVTRLLARIRFNEVPVRLGLSQNPIEGQWSPANIAGYIVMVLILLFGVLMAADLLAFDVVNQLVSQFTEFFALVIWAVVILGIGLFIANMVAKIISGAGRSPALASAVRVFIILLAVAIALRTMGFANDIILLGFGLMLAAIAVAIALAFGMGGREVARDQLDRWAKALRSGDEEKS